MKKILILSAFDNYSYNVRMKYVEKYFEDMGYNVVILSADFDHRSKTRYCIKRRNLKYVHVRKYKRNFSIARILSHKEYAKKAFRYASIMKPEIIYIATPPNYLFKYANKYKKNNIDTKMIFEIGDMWPETLPVNNRIKKLLSPFLKAWKLLRDRYIGCGDGIIFECELFYKYLKNKIKDIPAKVIYLTKDIDGRDTFVPSPKIEKEVSFCYVGSLNNIFDENLTSELLNQIALTHSVNLHLIGDGEKKSVFLKMLRNVNVIDHGIVYDEEKKAEIYSQCHIALNLMKTNVFVGLTMKSIEYFAAGLPMINNIPEDTMNIIEKKCCGFNYAGDVYTLIDWIDSLDDKKIANMKKNSYDVYKEFFTLQVFNDKLNNLINDII